MSLRIGSLFSGIGGLELGLERAGLGRVVWQVERDPFCRAVLARHWPGADRSVCDVRAASPLRLAAVDVLAGGFPCQDVSGAGKGAGLDGARSGLWWEFRRCVGAFQPRIVIVENVASGAARWLCPVRTSLHALGYDSAALAVSAEDVGAPQRRARIFVVAHRASQGLQGGGLRGRPAGSSGGRWPTPTSRDATSGAGHGATMQGAPSLRTLVRWPTPTRYGSGQNGSPHDGRDAFAGAGTPSLDTIAAAEGGRLNPAWVEVLMGFPQGWTEIQAGLFDGLPDPANPSTDGSHPEPHPESLTRTSG